MPSNQCTITLMELGFAIGNMAGAGSCDEGDYKQLEDILSAWQCRETGEAGKLVDTFTKVVQDAQGECEGGECPAHYCVDSWKLFNSLVKEVQPQDLEGTVMRGPIPPKVKGPQGISRSRRGTVLPYVGPSPPPPPPTNGAESGSRHYEGHEERKPRTPYRGMSNGGGGDNEERRGRWYPARV